MTVIDISTRQEEPTTSRIAELEEENARLKWQLFMAEVERKDKPWWRFW